MYVSMGRGPGDRQESIQKIRFGSYNIRKGRNRGLESTICGMSQVNVDFGVFQYTKVVGGGGGGYASELSGYRFAAT